MKYIIYDNTDNSMTPYISFDNNSNTGDIESAMTFDSEEEAQSYIDSNDWNDWACVIEK